MTYREIVMSIFDMPDNYTFMHCISSDLAMGKGIAVEFNQRFHLKKSMREMKIEKKPQAIKVGRVINLITKEKYWHKPTNKTFREALVHSREIILSEGINRIAIPTLGSELDKLDWKSVRKMIREVFEDDSIDIVVCINNPVSNCVMCHIGHNYVRNNEIFCTVCNLER